jgi:hypothetical protein
VELALALATYLVRSGCPTAGVVAAPVRSVAVTSAFDAVALTEAVRRLALA